jgi:glycosyltransferase involved in cell wall biosynthesis
MILDHIDPWISRRLYNPYQDLKLDWRIWRRWRQEHRRHPYDLVQVANVSSVGLFFRWERRLPVVTRMSSFRPDWDKAAGMEHHGGAHLRWHMEKLAVKGTRYVYAPSHFVARSVERAYGLQNVDVIETPFFTEPINACHDLANAYRGKSYAIFFGRLTQMKGAHILAQSLSTVLRYRPALEVLFVGGDSISPNGGSMRAYILEATKEFSDRVHLLEPQRHDLLYPLIERARFVVLPSLIDNLPNTCLEAMGLRLPVIATTGSCFEQLIEDGDSGFLVPPNDSHALAERIIAVDHMPNNELRRIGDAAHNRILQLHPSRAIPRLIGYYDDVLADFHPRRTHWTRKLPSTATAR